MCIGNNITTFFCQHDRKWPRKIFLQPSTSWGTWGKKIHELPAQVNIFRYLMVRMIFESITYVKIFTLIQTRSSLVRYNVVTVRHVLSRISRYYAFPYLTNYLLPIRSIGFTDSCVLETIIRGISSRPLETCLRIIFLYQWTYLGTWGKKIHEFGEKT